MHDNCREPPGDTLRITDPQIPVTLIFLTAIGSLCPCDWEEDYFIKYNKMDVQFAKLSSYPYEA